MKLLIILCLLLTGCTTVYKVDSSGVCHAPNGKVVNIADVDPYSYNKQKDREHFHPVKIMGFNGGVSGGANYIFDYMLYWSKISLGGTTYGW